jgi:hypothetical protein
MFLLKTFPAYRGNASAIVLNNCCEACHTVQPPPAMPGVGKNIATQIMFFSTVTAQCCRIRTVHVETGLIYLIFAIIKRTVSREEDVKFSSLQECTYLR